MGCARLWVIQLLLLVSTLAPRPLHAQNDGGGGSGAPSAAASADDPAVGPLRRVGGAVLPPKLLNRVDPKFSDQARAARFSGVVLIGLIVDTDGIPRNVHVVRGVGMGLDEEALAAVKQYVFQPATENGNPVPVRINVEVNFQIFDGPTVLHSVPLELTDEARRKHASGTILVAFTIDPNGNPQNVRVVRGVGMGMDERALQAIRQYRFAPTLKDGHAISRPASLQLTFGSK